MESKTSYTLLNGDTSTGQKTISGNRRFYDYFAICILCGSPIRGSIYMPTQVFSTFGSAYIPIIYDGSIAEIDIKYIDDTTINITQNNKGLNVFIYGYKW